MAIDGQPYAPQNPAAARRAGVAMIHQELSLAPHLSVKENILLGVEPTRYGFLRRGEMARDCDRALGELGHGAAQPRHDRRDAVRPGAADRGDRASHRGRMPGARARRADQQPRSRGRAPAVRDARPAAQPGPCDRLHLAFPRRGHRDRRSLRRLAGRPECRRGADRRRHARCDRGDDDRRIGTGDCSRGVLGSRASPFSPSRRSSRATRRSRCIAARSSASPA